MDSQTEEALVASKVDYLAEEYSQLLVSQLDEQRAYFSGLLAKQAEEAESRVQESSERCQSLEKALQIAPLMPRMLSASAEPQKTKW